MLQAFFTKESSIEAGQVVSGRYRLLSEIGAGGMGRVFKAEQLSVGRIVALKVIHPDILCDRASTRSRLAFESRFTREATALAGLRQRNIVTLFDFGAIEESGGCFMVMEFLQGESLMDKIKREGPLPEAFVRELARQTCLGLREVHSRGLVHRDFKPGNLFLANEGGESVVKLLDFGLVKSLMEDDRDRLTETGLMLGSPLYIAPEQAFGTPVDARSDLYALGCVLYCCLAGKPPFGGAPGRQISQHLHARPPRLVERCPGVDVSPELERLLRWCLEKSPSNRPQSADQLLQALQALPPVKPAAVTPRPARPAQRRSLCSEVTVVERRRDRPSSPRFWIAFALALVVAGLGGVALAQQLTPPVDQVFSNATRHALSER